MRSLTTPDRRLAEVAGTQHGVVSRAQLYEMGFDNPAVERRIAGGRLHRLHRGVYAVGHKVVSWRGAYLAAVLACGEGAVLSHRSAADLWGHPADIDTADRRHCPPYERGSEPWADRGPPTAAAAGVARGN